MKIPKVNLATMKAALAKIPKPRKRELVAVTLGVALGAGGMALQPEPSAGTVQNVAPIEVGVGELPSPLPYGPQLPPGSDTDQDGLSNVIDACPWNAGAPPKGCP